MLSLEVRQMRRVNLTAVLQETRRSNTSVNKKRNMHITVMRQKKRKSQVRAQLFKRRQLNVVRRTILEQNPTGYASTWVYYLGHI